MDEPVTTTSDTSAPSADRDQRVLALERPHENLVLVYLVQSLAALVFAPIAFLPLYFKYRTLRYQVDEEGISVSWGILFRREVHLTYRRIQDIHLRRNLVERWLGLGTVQIQTASGSAEAEMSLVGIRDYEAVRDFLYRRMRGQEADAPVAQVDGEATGGEADSSGETAGGEMVRLLTEIRDELAAARAALESRR